MAEGIAVKRDTLEIVVDSREQRPWNLARFHTDAAPVYCTIQGLPTGDYSLAGLEDWVTIERKNLSDLAQCCGRDRDRFVRELERLAVIPCACVIVEGHLGDILAARYASRIHSEAVLASITDWSLSYGVQFIMAGYRMNAEAAALAFLRRSQTWVFRLLDSLGGHSDALDGLLQSGQLRSDRLRHMLRQNLQDAHIHADGIPGHLERFLP